MNMDMNTKLTAQQLTTLQDLIADGIAAVNDGEYPNNTVSLAVLVDEKATDLADELCWSTILRVAARIQKQKHLTCLLTLR